MKKVFITDSEGNKTLPKTHVTCVFDDEGLTLNTILGDKVDLSTNQTVSGQKTFSQNIVGNVVGNATTATTAQNLASKGTSDYFYMADGSISNGYNLVQAMVDEWSSDAGGTLASYQCSSTVYDDIFTS